MKNGCVLLSVYIIILLSSVELRADEINNVYKTVQQLPIEQCDENGNLWDFRDVVITGDSRIRIRNFGDSIIDRTSIFERNDFSRNGDSIFIIGFENYKYDLSCDSPQYLFNISDDGTRKTSYNLTGKAFRQYPVYLSGEVEIERSNQGAILMPAGDTIRNVDCMRQVYRTVIFSKDSVTVADSVMREVCEWYVSDLGSLLARSSHTCVYAYSDSIPYRRFAECILNFEYKDDIEVDAKREIKERINDKNGTGGNLKYEPIIDIKGGVVDIHGISSSEEYRIYVCDISGRVIVENIPAGYDISQLSSGQYIVWLECAQGIISKNFTVK